MRVNAPTTKQDAPLYLQFDDNRLLPHLYGKQDEHLARIEKKLSVSIVSRGNRLAISGPPEHVRMARAALEALYRRLQKEQDVDAGEVDAALRLAVNVKEKGTLLDFETYAIPTRKRLITPRSAGQVHYIQALQASELVVALGPAGSGKTYLAVAMAASMLMTGQVDRIILSRPAVEAGERLGFLPGDLREKIDPYLRPLYEALHDMMPLDQVNRRLASGEIEIAPLAFMRGRTLSNAFVILDEAQNTTAVQMKMLLTRLGENARMTVTGDLTQVDLPKGVRSGLRDSLEILTSVDGVRIVELSDTDVVRHPLVSDIVRAYDARDQQEENTASDPYDKSHND
ncbi:MAG: PhoH family protein [Alphaproteobacteria bacterium]|nr:PhoH family protein [Alphaproteobacteria bacterium]